MPEKKQVKIPVDPLVSRSQLVEETSFAVSNRAIKNKGFRFSAASAGRRSTVMGPSARYHAKSVYGMQLKWQNSKKAVKKMSPLYEGNKWAGYTLLIIQFLKIYVTIWWAKRNLSTRVMRKLVVCQIVGLIIMGFLFSTGGVFNISLASKRKNGYTLDFYWAMTIVSLVVFTLAVMGCVGVFRPNMFITQIYAVASFIFGHLIFSVVLAWYLLVMLDEYLSGKYFHHSTTTPPPPTPNREKMRINASVDEDFEILRYESKEKFYQDRMLRQYCIMLMIASIIMMSSGVLTTKLIIQVRRKQGYLSVNVNRVTYQEPMETSDPGEGLMQESLVQAQQNVKSIRGGMAGVE